jgi:hypothetical protein
MVNDLSQDKEHCVSHNKFNNHIKQTKNELLMWKLVHVETVGETNIFDDDQVIKNRFRV